MTTQFDQAAALIKRSLEGCGGSADAYEDPEKLPQQLPLPVGDVDQEPVADDEDEGSCGTQFEWPEEGELWTAPDPKSEQYQLHGTVEDSGELKPLWDAFYAAVAEDKDQPVELEGGTFMVSWKHHALGKSLTLEDPTKDRLYVYDASNGPNLDSVFIWVSPLSGGDLGYIHNGYVFLRK